MAIIKKSTINKCLKGCEEKRTLLHCWWECKLVHQLWRRVRRFLKKLKNRATTLPSNLTLGHISRKHKNSIWKDTRTPMFITALFTTAKIQKQLMCPSTDNWLKKMQGCVCVYTHNGILLHHKKDRNNAIYSNMDGLENIILTKGSQTKKPKYYIISFICGI